MIVLNLNYTKGDPLFLLKESLMAGYVGPIPRHPAGLD